MNNRESQNQNNTTDNAGVNKKRRIILGAGAVAPVALTFMSPPVLGTPAQCLSQQMSGNVSRATASCNTGLSPLAWKNKPKNQWPAGFTKFLLGTDDPTKCSQWKRGTKFNDTIAFPGESLSAGMANILCAGTESLDAYYVAAMLNAQVQGSGFVLTVAQVRALRKGNLSQPPGFPDKLSFLKAICSNAS